MLNETLTLRSDPMEERAPNVVPPTPPVAIGLPLIASIGTSQRYHDRRLSKHECELASSEGFELINRIFSYHRQESLCVRRLILAQPHAAHARKRKAGDVDAVEMRPPRASTRGHAHASCGAIFGCTVGNMVAYLEGRGIPAERAHILRTVRERLLPVAESLRYMSGTDATHLSRGMASCRIVSSQRSSLPELNTSDCPRIDAKYGHVGTAVGTTAALIATFGMMASVPSHCCHLVSESAFVRLLRIAEAKIEAWKPSTPDWPDEHEQARCAEARALRRACIAAREAMDESVALNLDPEAAMELQLEWARIAAFPGGERVDATTHDALCTKTRSRALFTLATQPLIAPRSIVMTSTRSKMAPNVLPLSEIPEALLGTGKRQCVESDTNSASGTSSWITLSSNASSTFSNVSNDSLSGLVSGLEQACR